jgi:F0F1-type ATP synthase membrane subunit b/b'
MNHRVIALLASEDPFVSHHWLFPETGEIIYGGLASVIVVGALVKFAGPMAKKSFAERTARIQKQLDDAAAAKVTADGDAKNIRAALGDMHRLHRFLLMVEHALLRRLQNLKQKQKQTSTRLVVVVPMNCATKLRSWHHVPRRW